MDITVASKLGDQKEIHSQAPPGTKQESERWREMNANNVNTRYVNSSRKSRFIHTAEMRNSNISGAIPFAMIIAFAGIAILLSLISVGTFAYSKAYADEQPSSFSAGVITTLNAMGNTAINEGKDTLGTLDVQADTPAQTHVLAQENTPAQTDAPQLHVLAQVGPLTQVDATIQSEDSAQVDAPAQAEVPAQADAAAHAGAPVQEENATSTTMGNEMIASQQTSSLPRLGNSTIDIDGVQMGYVDSYLSASAPSTGAGLWLGSDSTTDGSFAYFVGHNPGPFWHVMDLTNGDAITVCDSTGATRTYHVVRAFIVPNTTYLEDIQYQISGYGESVILQTCCGDNATYRIVIAA